MLKSCSKLYKRKLYHRRQLPPWNWVIIYRFLIHRYSCFNKCNISIFCDVFKNHFKTGKNNNWKCTYFFPKIAKNVTRWSWLVQTLQYDSHLLHHHRKISMKFIASVTNLSSSFMYGLAKKEYNVNMHAYNLISN